MNKKQNDEPRVEKIQVEEENEEIPLQEEDFEYFGSDQANLAFVKRITENVKQKKRKLEVSEEKSYEKSPRNNFYDKDDKKVYRSLLPVKIKNKIIPQQKEVKQKESDVEEDMELEEEVEEQAEQSSCAAEQIFKQQQNMVDIKRKMALIALSVIENPQEKYAGLRQLRLLLEEVDNSELKVMVRKLGMITLMEVFRDIIPSYKIRKLTDQELQQKTSKETKSLQNYEESLLVSYKHYLEYLWSVVSGEQKKKEPDINQQDHQVLKEIAIKCLCELLINCHHFNFSNELVSFVVACMNLFNKKGSETACEAIKQVFRTDKLGATTLTIVKAIENLIKSKKTQIKPAVLNTFLSLKIKEIEINPAAGKLEKEKRKQKLMKMSRNNRKREKQLEKLERELLETKASEDKKKKCEFNTLTIQHIFATYIRILKKSPESLLLSSVLEGLAKFAHFINIDYFDDLFAVLKRLIASEQLTAQQCLHCALTAFIILSGQGQVLNIDPVQFYKHVYENLVQVDAACTSTDVNVILECLEAMIFKRKKQLTESRIVAFMKRLSTLCLHALPETSIALLGVVRSIVHSFPCSEVMFENDYLSGSGVFSPELGDPEYCNASNTSLWELHLLKKHVSPTVSLFANHVIHQAPLTGAGQLPPHLAKLSAMDLYEKFSAQAMTFGKG